MVRAVDNGIERLGIQCVCIVCGLTSVELRFVQRQFADCFTSGIYLFDLIDPALAPQTLRTVILLFDLTNT